MDNYTAERIFGTLTYRINKLNSDFCCFKANICNNVSGCISGGGSPSLPLNSIQYNNSGSFFGDALFTRNPSTNVTLIGKNYGGNNQSQFELSTNIFGSGLGGAVLSYRDTSTNQKSFAATAGNGSQSGFFFSSVTSTGQLNVNSSTVANPAVGYITQYQNQAINQRSYFQMNGNYNELSWDFDQSDDIKVTISQSQNLQSTGNIGNMLDYQNTSNGLGATFIVGDTRATSGAENSIIGSVSDSVNGITGLLKMDTVSGNTLLWNANTSAGIDTVIQQSQNLFGLGIAGSGLIYEDTSSSKKALILTADFGGGDYQVAVNATNAANDIVTEFYATSNPSIGAVLNFDNQPGSTTGSLQLRDTGNRLIYRPVIGTDPIYGLIQNENVFSLNLARGSYNFWSNDPTSSLVSFAGAGDFTQSGGAQASTAMISYNTNTADSARIQTVTSPDMAIVGYAQNGTAFATVNMNSLDSSFSYTSNSFTNTAIIGATTSDVHMVYQVPGSKWSFNVYNGSAKFQNETDSNYWWLIDVNNDDYAFGDLNGAGNHNLIWIEDDNNIISARTPGYFHVTDPSNVEKFKVDVANSRVSVSALLNLQGYTVGTLPAGTVGDIAYVTDALLPSFLVAVVGGGAVKTPVFYDGANWVAF